MLENIHSLLEKLNLTLYIFIVEAIILNAMTIVGSTTRKQGSNELVWININFLNSVQIELYESTKTNINLLILGIFFL